MEKKAKSIKYLARVFRMWRNLRAASTSSYTATHRIINIEKNEHSEYFVTIQLIGKNSIQTALPEELLADDKIVNRFSPTDIRTLTYLGYLGINAPKYKILAKKLSEKNDQMLFALRKKGERKYSVLTANEITKDTDILKGLTQEEAYMFGITTGNEQQILEKKQKEQLLKSIEDDAIKKLKDKKKK